MTLDGTTGWRLPTVNELASLVDSPTGVEPIRHRDRAPARARDGHAAASPDAVAGFSGWTSNAVHPAATSGLVYRVQFGGTPLQYQPVVAKDSKYAANGVRCVK